ncbi:MAG: dihydrolipoyl dehydrogenase [Trueperaceae bacterium]|nr:dihydrolipoyl dehydrogenase [Trueperaceae bacterium]
MDYDLIVIGSGPGGYHAAIRAAQLGLKTAVVEKGDVGGVCLNIGCIPTKALLHVAHTLEESKHASDYGVRFGAPEVDLEALEAWKAKVVQKHTGGVGQLLKGNKVDLIQGEARFVDPHTLQVGDRTVSADKLIVATGSRPVALPGFELDGDRVVDSTGALRVPSVPKRFMALGGSAIGLEFADVYAALGSEVAVVEFMDRIVPTADVDASKALHKALTQRGITLKTGTKAVAQKETKAGTEVTLEANDGARETVVVDKLLVAVGRRPNGHGLGLEEIGVTVDEKGFVPTSETMQTNVPNVYAIGDVAKGPLLAHKAMKEGLVAAEHAAGKKVAYDTLVPGVIYTNPELASVGMTEAEATEAGFEVRVGNFPLTASGRATTMGATIGLMKVIGDAKSDLVLGVHIVSPGAGDLIAEATLAMEMGTTLEDLAATQHPHPTLSEGLMEAAEHALGHAIHISNRRR